ncbi:MAG: NapC/NirT family cytochrome c, partial [bacterium]
MILINNIAKVTINVITAPYRLMKSLGKRISFWGWRRIVLTFAIIGVIAAILLALFVEVTSQPGFCVTCHYMRPYFASWKESSHKNVPCTMCHYPPGFRHTVRQKFTAVSMVVNYITGIYKRSKPWAEISDE